MSGEAGGDAVPMQINVLRNSKRNTNGLEKSIGIEEAAVKHGIGQLRNGCDFAVYQVALAV
jgi:hypothetical protein